MFGGSWSFIIMFFAFLMVWMLVNVFVLASKPFDPYPFLLLNLILSCLAAIQAPLIMMSQNHQEEKDRRRVEHDYKINLKAEPEIKLLSEKSITCWCITTKSCWRYNRCRLIISKI